MLKGICRLIVEQDYLNTSVVIIDDGIGIFRKIKEVVLVFDGIQWIGQGFAHHIFVVFAKEHPDIHLIPINMNEDVTKMYVHVLG